MLNANTLFFVASRGFFLRHTQTGKCITASEELVYYNLEWAFPYFVVMTDNCLDDKAQFRYLDSELLHNIEKQGTLVSPREIHYYGRWTVYKGISTDAQSDQNRAEHRLKQTAAGSLFFYSRSDPVCAEPSMNYLLRKSYCSTRIQQFTFGKLNIQSLYVKQKHLKN
jgi:hypothetical protein